MKDYELFRAEVALNLSRLAARRDRNQRKIREIIIHCSATPQGREVEVDEIDRWHRNRGFSGIGYHYIVHIDGRISAGRRESRAGAHCAGHNRCSIGICYVGGCDLKLRPSDTRTERQRIAMEMLVAELKKRFPAATIHGHCEFASKACPSFDVGELVEAVSRTAGEVG